MAGEGKTFQRHYDIPNSAEHVTSATEGLSPRVRTYIPDVTGALKVRFRADSEGAAAGASYVTFNVIAGQEYRGDIEGFATTGSVASQAITVFRQR
jgi:hypothetical protein